MAVGAPIESGIGTLHIGKQTAQGSVKATGDAGWQRVKWAGGELRAAKEIGSEEYVDGQRFGSPAMFTQKAGGEVGTVEVQAQIGSTAAMWAWLLGSDTVTGGSDPYTHTITSAGTAGSYVTLRKKVGANVGPVREVYWDAKFSRGSWNAGGDQMVAHSEFDVMALKAAEFSLTDPATAETTDDPVVWTEVDGQAKLNTVQLDEISGETVEVQTNMEPFWGDAVLPAALVEGKGEITRQMRTIVTAETIKQLYNAIYGTQTPTGGTTVTNTVINLDMDTKYVRSASRDWRIWTPRVAVDPADMRVSPLPEGGAVELVFSGRCRIDGANPALTHVVRNGDSTSYIA